MQWEKKEISPDLVKAISSKYGCDLLTASILVRRGMVSGRDIKFFLEDDPRRIGNPFELPGMEDAVERILAAKEEGEKILVFGDRDVDGISAAALLTNFLASEGMDVSVRIPSGDEPYGLSLDAVEKFAAAYGTLIITVDCGISNFAEVKRAAELGIDVIVTDHHNPQETLPSALAIVNPKLNDSPAAFRDFSGCGVAYKLVSALRFAIKSELYGQSVCLLNTRPVNDAWVIEIAKLKNLAVIDSLTETVVPGLVSINETHLPSFLLGQQIFVWDASLQKKTLANIFGNGVEILMLDIAAEIGKEIPSARGKSLLRIKELSKIAKYEDAETSELDVFVNLFISFVRQREKHLSPEDSLDLQLACLGTLADIMPLVDENRIIVRQGLKSLAEKPRPGLSELLYKIGLQGRPFGTTDISWSLCPVINAAGRMGDPGKALDLLLEKDPKERDSLASLIIDMNEDRKKLGEEIWRIVEPLAAENLNKFDNKIAFASGASIPRGVTGIMANRLIGRFKIPSLVVSFGEKIYTGSLRSVRNYDLTGLLEPCSGLFLDWGGHNYAAGFSISEDKWKSFLDYLESAVKEINLPEEEDEDTLSVDAELPLSYMTPEIYSLVDRFEPYGEKNEALLFIARKLRIVDVSLMGKPELKHVKLTLDTGKHKWPAVYWQAVEKVKRDFDLGDNVDLVFKFTRNWFKGMETPQLVISDLKRCEN